MGGEQPGSAGQLVEFEPQLVARTMWPPADVLFKRDDAVGDEGARAVKQLLLFCRWLETNHLILPDTVAGSLFCPFSDCRTILLC